MSATFGTVRETVSATGTIEPAVQSSVSFQVSGKVTSVRVAEGQIVKAGTVLATIDSASLQANLAQAKAALATAQAKLSTDTDAGAAATALAADTASVTSAQNEVASAQTSLSEATLTSPVAGVVATVDLTVGQQVGGSSAGSNSSGSGSSGSGTGTGSGGGAANSTSSTASSSSSSSQFLVISTSSWIVNASVDSTSIGLIANGNQVQLVPGSGSQTVYGTVTSIGILSSGSSSGVATYPVVVDVTGDPAGMHAGDSATLSIIYRQRVGQLDENDHGGAAGGGPGADRCSERAARGG